MADLLDLAQRFVRAYPDRRDEALAALNGAIGDRLEAADSALALRMQLFYGARPWALEDPPIAVPNARPQACLFVHGLMGSERAWRFGVGAAQDEGPRVDYGPVLAAERDQTPVYVRYNSGRHISENGRELAEKLAQLHAVWPFEELSIVAHSMGGLVTRSACHYALEAGHAWTDSLRRVFLLGAPSRGAPLEQLAHVTAFTLDSIWNPWTKLIGKAIKLRSAGIKDLRHGFVLDEDWRHHDADRLAFPVPARPRDPAHVRWFIAVGTLGQPGSPLSATLGDGLVRRPSARGASLDPRARELLPPAEVQTFASTGHMALMNDRAVLEQLLEWWQST
ncbi:PGAP1-like protein [Enhygromyxa salina]|uniref:PGAP1-like protein n=1 Tax=Enhygromyxa salina TaxID=215803 RepID=A0A2S9YGK2_9BACT|nr:permease [Enhygromyxa salina]PRQ04243.1 PGAP1-like protein [Enhygromyxa salina]